MSDSPDNIADSQLVRIARNELYPMDHLNDGKRELCEKAIRALDKIETAVTYGRTSSKEFRLLIRGESPFFADKHFFYSIEYYLDRHNSFGYSTKKAIMGTRKEVVEIPDN